MVVLKTVIFAAVLAVVSSRTIRDDVPYFVEDRAEISQDDVEDGLSEPLVLIHPSNLRVRRQVHGMINTNPDGSANVLGKLPLAGNNQNVLSALGTINGAKPGGSFGAAGAGLGLDNV